MYSPFIILNDRKDLRSFNALSVISLKGLGEFTQSKEILLAFARIPRAEVRGAVARGGRGEARMARLGSFGTVPLGFAHRCPTRKCRELQLRLI